MIFILAVVPDGHAEIADVRAIEVSLFDDLQVRNEAAAIWEFVDWNHPLALSQRHGRPCCGAHHPDHHCQRRQQCRNHHRRNRHPPALSLHHLAQNRSYNSRAHHRVGNLTHNTRVPKSLWTRQEVAERTVKAMIGNGQGAGLRTSRWCNPIHIKVLPQWMSEDKEFSGSHPPTPNSKTLPTQASLLLCWSPTHSNQAPDSSPPSTFEKSCRKWCPYLLPDSEKGAASIIQTRHSKKEAKTTDRKLIFPCWSRLDRWSSVDQTKKPLKRSTYYYLRSLPLTQSSSGIQHQRLSMHNRCVSAR